MLLIGSKKHGFALSSKCFIFIYAVLVFFRFWLTGDRDIVATNSPYDEYWYIESASRYIWGGGYTHMAFAQIPTYSIWLLSLNFIGIPARLGIDALWICSSLYLALAITRFTRWRVAGLLVFLLLGFHPYAIMVFDRGLAETLLGALTVLTLAAGIEVWNLRSAENCLAKRLSYILFVAGFAFAYLTRKEGIVLLAPLIVVLFFSFFQKDVWWHGRYWQKLGAKLIIAPLLATIFLGGVISVCNYSRLHMLVLNELSAPGYQSAVKALNSIDVGRTPKHATVTAAARSLAYEVSPTFRELAPFFEGPIGKEIAAHPIAGSDGEIGNGWFYWALRDAGATAGWFTSAKKADKKFSQIALDINNGFEQGKLIKRPYVLSSFIDPDMGKWVGDVPDSTWKTFLLLILPRYQFEPPNETATPIQFEKYVSIDGRRKVPQERGISGWVAAPLGSLLALAGDETPNNWKSIGPQRRADISAEAYPFQLSVGANTVPKYIYLKGLNGEISKADISKVRAGDSISLQGKVNSVIGVDEVSSLSSSRLDKVFASAKAAGSNNYFLYQMYSFIGYLLSVAIVVGFILSVFANHKDISFLILIVMAGLAARCLTLGILDASSWPGTQVRYVFPALPFFVTAGVIGFYATVRSIQTIARRTCAPQSL
ncbi:hypothetical protein [Pseudomonas lactucae]|uniref:Uncharacterized protein n=1 Tax=Pseudomonas lactucae TaxID=2813360 RepID=A0A9X1C312_9PSED|nr:hypothetical protein [Pseudomonas lactucae]MBN2975171.1 hypothetical protein [Pseudomonas lactucae]MBN2986723.1 hypothetical protein [Pseudomonas lactucae]